MAQSQLESLSYEDPYVTYGRPQVNVSGGDAFTQQAISDPTADPTQPAPLVRHQPGNQRDIANNGEWTWGTDPTQSLLAGLNAGQSGQTWVDAYNKQFGLQPGSSLAYYGDNNTYALPSGYAAIGPNGQWGWNPRTGATANTGAASVAAPVTTPVPLAAPFSPNASIAGGPGTGPNSTALFNLLMGRAGQSLNIGPDDPIIKAQTDAFKAQEVNQWRNLMSAEAERGGANANTDAVARSAGERIAQDTGSFAGQAMATELQQRRADIQNAIASAAGLLTADQQMQLQDELQKINAQLELTGLNVNQSEFEKQLAENAFEFDTNNANKTFGA